ncbi:MAG: SPOR domain-containing protein [Sulfitobacter litoralis]|nr:SPOR domain-containing protein [Sulfitobacter litoralis]MBQ0766814.1 SPOR domain-containing protein [Sulfitobacter litoralis]MBQ0801801.1 SPOR domain-containing protein [Sulfitobacter litoralis]MCF7725196.1 SPOR domain-containing protein [Sulfitobacter sp. M22]MCF7776604.1 SPOR domain-containing protein [Sulfitobacter sp. M220]
MSALGAGIAQAQSFRDQPAEFPSASYKGKQYVDSKGCVYIRAGIDGNVTWVPRVSRKRQGVCGFKPTNVQTAASAPAGAADAPVQITVNSAPVAAKQPTVAARPLPQRKAKPVVVRQKAPKVVRQPVPRSVDVPAAPITQAPVAVAQVPSTCAGRSAISQQYSGSRTKGVVVRCGPQTAPILPSTAQVAVTGTAPSHVSTTRRVTAPAKPAPAHAYTRIVPKHVAINRQNTYANVAVPKGYRPVWEDDRLNPKRAEQNLAGRSQMLLIWTNTVPRRLINQKTGQDVTARLPLVYPYTSVEQQRRDLGDVTFAKRNGQLVKRIVRNKNAAPAKRKPVYSSRSAPKPVATAPATPRAAGKTYVQIGVYGDSANAQRAAQRIARMGMGARIGKSTRGGKTYLSVQAGPFGASSAPAALGKLRGAGYGDAYIR